MTEVDIEMKCRRTSTMAFASVLILIISFHSCNAQVPLLTWTSEGYSLPHLTQPPAGKSVYVEDLMSYLKSALSTAPHNLLLFLQDKLSIDDFTVYGGVFGNKRDSVFINLEAALQASSNPLVLPSLVWSSSDSVAELFERELGTPALHINPNNLEEIQLNPSQPSMLVIQLPYTTGVHSKELLLKNDKIIGEVLDIFKSRGVPYTAVYTGLKPSVIIQDIPVLVESSQGRTLLQTAPQSSVKPPLIFNNTEGKPCILLWADTLNVKHSEDNWFDLGPQTFGGSANLTGSSCNETHARLVLNYQNVSGLQIRVIFSMRNSFFPVSARNWSVLEQMLLEFNGQTYIYNGSRAIYSPAEYSFHCQSISSTDTPLLVPTNTTTPWKLSFNNFQIQGFGVAGTDFSYASDCTGFFSPGIWMGLVVSLILLLILTYGLHMIMHVHTMDRFDDPKGPAISVPLNE